MPSRAGHQFAEGKVTSAELIKKLMVKMASDMNPVNSLSGGNQQKVVIAKWLMGDPQIIILDDHPEAST